MRTIWKYPVKMDDHFTLLLPKGAQPLSVALQHNNPQMWVMVDPEEHDTETRKFRVAGTGHPIGDEVGKCLGSLLFGDGDLVFHVFECN